MEEKNKTGYERTYESKKRSSASGIVIFLAVLAILLAIGGALLLRQMLKSQYEAQLSQQQVVTLTGDKQVLEQQLNELDAKFAELSVKYTDMEGLFDAERRNVSQLRAQLHGEGSAQGVAALRQRITELEEQLESYRQQLLALETEKETLTGENTQMRSTLEQTTSRNQQLETENKDMSEQLVKAGVLTVSNIQITALRERRRGDQPTTSAKRTDKLRICFNVNQNFIAKPGTRDFYIRIIDPNNQVLTLSPDDTIEFEGENIQYSLKRSIDYQNESQEVCVMWTQAEKYVKGYYNVVVFSEGQEVGYKLIQLN